MKILFIGNTGTGKSTLLNGLIERPDFESRVSFGGGLTKCLQLVPKEPAEGVIQCGDMLGLADPKIREQAAEEISKALCSGLDDCKIVFVVCLFNGRARTEDMSTVKLVVSALLKQKVPCGIIINQVEPEILEMLDSRKNWTELTTCFDQSVKDNPTKCIMTHAKVRELVAKRNVIVAPTTELQTFLDNFPSIRVDPSGAENVKSSEFEAIQERFAAVVKELEEDAENVKAKMEAQEVQHQKEREQMEENIRKLEEQRKRDVEEQKKGMQRMAGQFRKEVDAATAKGVDEVEMLCMKQVRNETVHRGMLPCKCNMPLCRYVFFK